MAIVLQIGAGGVGGVVAHKMAMNKDVFSKIILASRTKNKCKDIADSIRAKGYGEIEIDEVNADSVESVVALIEKYHPKLVVNVALPYQDLTIMEACLRTRTHYLDTANYEHPDSAHFEYKEQWAYDTRYKQAGIFALLGSGFDPGVTNVFCAYAQKHYFDAIYSIDILDCNAGDHGYAFATNFNPEINLREVSSKARYWVKDSSIAESTSLESNLALNDDLQKDTIYRKFEREEKHFKLESNTQSLSNQSYAGGQWRDIAPLALMKEWDYPEVGVKNSYLLYHEELESLVRNIKGLRKIRFFMTFGESYLTHMKVLENIGFLRIDEVSHKGGKIVPIEVLKTLLPDPASLASRTKGQTHIGCYIRGIKDGKERTIYIYNICAHEECFKEVNAQGVSYTTGVPAMIGAKLIVEGKWGVGSNLTQDTRILESYNTERLELNKDMPKGGEYQGIDNALELQKQASNDNECDVKVVTSDRNSKIVDEKSELRSCECGDKTQASIAQMSDKPSDLSLQAEFQGAGVWNMEQNDPDPFMCELNKQGLPYVVLEISKNGECKVLEDGRR
ncbi:saccharopine dehydrogenase family protein [Helicobacter himalayensis]|uniref:saccharopine dehydrogenase family protein n=1 Tax=Helicobacter himalayensis TaxID=1591088 RepID=UPI00082C0567|nr:saccharopine dehydrogenase family protein [Helicobacter himalayensis]